MTTVNRKTWGRACARLLYDFMGNGWRWLALSLVLPSVFFGPWLYSHIASPAALHYTANAAAADEFVAAVNADWFFNRPLIIEKLERVAATYIATEEDDPAKLGELRRLKVWVSAAVSVADQQQFIAEVRGHGKVVMSKLFACYTELAVTLTVLLWFVSLLLMVPLSDALMRISNGETKLA